MPPVSAPMNAHPLFAIALIGGATAGEPSAEWAALQTERQQVEAEGKDLRSQLWTQRERLDELQRRIDEMRRRNAALDNRIQQVIDEHRDIQGAPSAASGASPAVAN